MTKWRNSKYMNNRKLELCFSIIFGTGGMIFGNILPNSLIPVLIDSEKNNEPSIGSYIFSFYIFISCIIIVGIGFQMYLLDSLIIHYKLGAIIMDELSLPINCQSIDDLFAWWELRKFYKHCIIKIYSSGFSSIITCAFILAFFAVYGIVGALTTDSGRIQLIFMNGVFLIYAGILSFILVTNAVSYHKNQLKHLVTCNKERLRFKKQHFVYSMKKSYDININKLQMDIIQESIDIILYEIKENSETIKCLGIDMNHNFLLFLRASAISITIAFISIMPNLSELSLFE